MHKKPIVFDIFQRLLGESKLQFGYIFVGKNGFFLKIIQE